MLHHHVMITGRNLDGVFAFHVECSCQVSGGHENIIFLGDLLWGILPVATTVPTRVRVGRE